VKRTIVTVLCVALVCVFAFAGCTPAPAAPSAAAATTAPAAAATTAPAAAGGLVAVFMPTKSLQRWNQDGDNMKKQLEAKGYTVDLLYGGENDVATQVSQIETEISKAPKVMVIASIDGTALGTVLQKVADAKIKVIAYDRLIMKTANVDYYATFDNFKVGTIQGSFIEDKLALKTAAGPFNIELFAGSPDDNNAKLFNQGAMSILQPYIDSGKLVVKSKQTDFTTIAIQSWKSETAQARMDNLLAANYTNAKLDAVLSPNDSLAIGIIAALDAVGYGKADKPYPVITGQDCDVANVKAIIAGKQSMSIFKDTRTLATQVVTMVDAILAGKDVPVNDTKSYDNGVKVVPTFLCDPVFADKSNYQKLLVDTGYYTADQLK
jgi:putative multiple sugar transport system substrate-binding protein